MPSANSTVAAARTSPVRGWAVMLPLFVLAAVVVLLPYAAGYGAMRITLAEWLRVYWADPTWQHGALALLISGFLVWRVRGRLVEMETTPSWLGLALCVVALLVFWVGYRGNFYFLGFASLQLLLAGGVLWMGGWRHFKQASFAWFVLGFAWPYLFIEESLSFRLRQLMVTLSAAVLNAFGCTTVRDGTSLISAATDVHEQGAMFSLNVDGPCSGMRSLFALMLVAVVFGYFRQRTWWRRALLFAASIPLAVLANMLRIIALIVASSMFGQNFAVGRGEEYTSNFHFIAGIGVFLVAFAGLGLAERLLNRFFGREKPLPLVEIA